ncbi:MAG: hypothetical protein LBQ18_06030 [Campylobacteraceae bacterium]|nr:hypothetical protein [Campylobacteraceae bacterium]
MINYNTDTKEYHVTLALNNPRGDVSASIFDRTFSNIISYLNRDLSSAQLTQYYDKYKGEILGAYEDRLKEAGFGQNDTLLGIKSKIANGAVYEFSWTTPTDIDFSMATWAIEPL